MDLIRKGIVAEKPGMLVEALFVLERPEGAPSSGDATLEFTRISQILTSLSSLQGIEYWSESRKAWRTFYAESWRIDDATARNRLPDSPRRVGAEGLTLYAWQKDLSFGGNVYRYEYAVAGSREAPSALLVTQTNLTRMSYGLIPLVGAEGLETRILIIQAREGILFYAASAANSPPIPILSGKLQDSFSNRAAALFKWFGARMSAGG